ncbi:MAG: YdcF family protein [Clostridia bacterium]|nr:YdcF family protein [Clostridia bacterium]
MLKWIEDITDFIFLEDTPRKADIIFIPGNAHALPSELAARLYQQGYASLILPSGRYAIGTSGFAGQKSGSRRYEGEFETEWAFMRRILMDNGVPEHAILREDEATYTYQNAIYSRKRTDAEKIAVTRAIICCMPVHARRSRMYYETLYPDAELLVCPAPDAAITRENWLKSAKGIDTVLGEMERCGGQFHDILKDLVL